MKRWYNLIGYSLLIFSSQILWVSFSPITTDLAKIMDVSIGKIGILTAIFPIIYIVVAFPAGRFIDTHFKWALGFGATAVGLGAVARFLFPFNYSWQLAIQCLLATGQPFIVNAIAAFASRNFPEKNRPLAISIASVSMFFGIIFAMVLSPLIFANAGLKMVYLVFATPSVASMFWIFYILKAGDMKEITQAKADDSVKLSRLFKDKFLWILSGLLAIGLGLFDVLSTWIEPIFLQFGIPGTVSGPLLALMIFSGIIGSSFLPSLVARKDARKTYMTITLFVTAATFFAITLWQWLPWVIFWLVFCGFLLLAGFPVILDWTEKHFDVHQHGTAVGFVMLSSHVGGVIMIYLVKIFIEPATLALTILACMSLLGLLLIRLLPKRENG